MSQLFTMVDKEYQLFYLTIACTVQATTDPFKISGAIAKATAAL